MSLDNRRIEFQTTKLAKRQQQIVNLSNYGSLPWDRIDCLGLPPHIRLVRSEKLTSAQHGSLESWQLILEANGSEIGARQSSGPFRISAGKIDEEITFLHDHDEGIRYGPIRFDLGLVAKKTSTVRTVVAIDPEPKSLSIADFSVTSSSTDLRARIESVNVIGGGKANIGLKLDFESLPAGTHQRSFTIAYGDGGTDQKFQLQFVIP
jgi:hypothetical protein